MPRTLRAVGAISGSGRTKVALSWCLPLVVLVAVAVVWSAARGSAPIQTVVAQFPADGAADIPAGITLDVVFDRDAGDAVDSLSFTLRDVDGNPVPAGARWSPDLTSATLEPAGRLSPGRYEASIETSSMASAYTWSFEVPARPRLSSSLGGPVLLVTDNRNPYDEFYAEMLRAEGLTSFTSVDLRDLSAAALDGHAVVLLSGTPDSEAMSQLRGWVESGGQLITMRPEGELADLAGHSPTGDSVTNGSLWADGSSTAGRELASTPIAVHAPARVIREADDTEVVARLTKEDRSSVAVTMRSVGSAGGNVAAFTFDLAQSVVLTRQGNPRWAGQDRDGIPPVRPNDLFFGGERVDDWVDLDEVDVPQADEQMRLLTSLLSTMTNNASPIPRFGTSRTTPRRYW